MAPKVNYAKLYRDAVNYTVSHWESYFEQAYPEKRNCIPMIKEKANQIFAEINKLQLKMGEPGPYDFIGNKVAELNLYAKTCIQTKNADQAIEGLNREIVLGAAVFGLRSHAADWDRRFNLAGTGKAAGCAHLVQGQAAGLLLQLKQMKDISPTDLSRASVTAMQHLDSYAHRCLQDGPAGVALDPPADLRNGSGQNSTPPTKRPNPDTETD
jgi:hypothetical protein